MADSKQLQIDLNLKDNISSGIKTANASIQSLSDNIAKAGDSFLTAGKNMENMGKAAAIRFAALGASVFGMANSFGDFEKSMSNVSTLVDTSTESMANMQKEILSMAQRTPVAISDLTGALYDVRSAGISAGDAMSVLESSAKLSVAGLSSTKEATNIMTSAMNAFSKEGLSAAQVSDILFKTVKAGKTTVSELAQAFGATAPIIQNAGFKLADFQAATAALTTVGVPASMAQNQLRAATVSLIKPTKEMSDLFKQLGVKDGRELIATSENMGEVFTKLKTASDNSGISLSKATGSVEALNAVLSISGATNKAYVATLGQMSDGSLEIENAFQKQSATFASSMQIFKNNAQTLAITIGSYLAPVITMVANKIQGFMQIINEHPMIGKMIATILLLSTAILGLVAAFGIIGGQLLQGIGIIMKVGQAIMVLTANVTSLNLAFLASPITWIILAIVAAVALLYWAFQNNFLGIKDILTNFFNFFKQTFTFIKSIATQVWNGLVAIVQAVFGKLMAIIKPVLAFYLGIWKAIYDGAKKAIGAIAPIFQGMLNVAKKIGMTLLNILLAPFKKMLEFFNWVLKKMGKEPINIQTTWEESGKKGKSTTAPSATSTSAGEVAASAASGGAGAGLGAMVSGGDEAAASVGAVSESLSKLQEGIRSTAETFTSDLVEGIVQGTVSIDEYWATFTTSLYEQILMNAFTPITEGMNQVGLAMTDIFNQTFGQLLNPITSFVGSAISMVAKMFSNFILQTLGFQKLFSLLTMGMQAVWTFLTNNMVTQWMISILTMAGTFLLMVIMAIHGFALMAASAAAAAVAMIPIIGWILAPIAYIATYALVIAGLAKVVGLAQGTSEVVGGAPSDTVPAMLTPGEMVVPKTMAEGVRSGDVTIGEGGAAAGSVTNNTYNISVSVNAEQGIDITNAAEIANTIAEGIAANLIPPFPAGAGA